jgi:endonuclease/exonuclease/phosphatase family metal-dependent hydrolase
MQFLLITYNIHKGIGGIDRRYKPERIVETLSHYDPDLVLLQEVDEGVPRSNHHRQVNLLGEALGLKHRAFQQNVRVKHGHYGNAILSRFPLSDVHDLDLSVRWKKRRRALVAHCHLHTEEHSRTLLVYNMHLGLAGYERAIQLRRILGHETLHRAHQGTAIVAAGDFNDLWGTLGRRLLEPAGFLPAARLIKTFPAFRPLRPLDGIYFRGNLTCLGSHASRIPIARTASDHLPIIAEFEIL